MKNVDLNLLPALQALLELRNVSRAAERLHLSQSAMSSSLARLRRHFNDDLLVRAGRGYELTPFAEALLPRVDRAMADVQDALHLHSDFEPATSDRRFVFAASDYVITLLMPHLRRRLREEAPNVRVEVAPMPRPSGSFTPDAFGQLDLIVGPLGFDFPGRSRALFRDDFVVLLDPSHPLLQQDTVTVADLAACPQVFGGFGGSVVTPAMRFFAEHGHTPHAVAQMSGLQSLPAVLPGTDLLALVPRRLAARVLRHGELVGIDLEADLEIPLVEGLFWHPLQTDDPGNAWLRTVFAEVAATLPEPTPELHHVVVSAGMDEVDSS